MRDEWTETLTLIASNRDLPSVREQIAAKAANFKLRLDGLEESPRRGSATTKLAVTLTGSPDHISDFEEAMAGDGWAKHELQPRRCRDQLRSPLGSIPIPPMAPRPTST